MFKVICDGDVLYDPRVKELALSSQKVTLEINKAGSFEFKIPPAHPWHDRIRRLTAQIEVWDGKEVIFSGRPIEEKEDYYKNKTIYCEGALAYLNDSIQRPTERKGLTVRSFLESLIASHNAQVEPKKRFSVGAVTVTAQEDELYRYTNYENTLAAIKEKLVDVFGGYLIVRRVGETQYLDYLEELPDTCSQTIEFGVNLLDYASNIDAGEIVTRLIPLGATISSGKYEDIDERVTIAEANQGSDYIQSEDAINTYGIVSKIMTWDDVSDAELLLERGRKYLESMQWDNMTLTVKAVDAKYINASTESFRLGDQVLVVSRPHGLNRYFPVTKMTIDLLNPANNTITMGAEVKTSITAKTNKVQSVAEKASTFTESSVLRSAKENADSLIKMATNGYIVLKADDKGNPEELLIMDTPDIKTATKVWRWNVNGLAYSSTGYDGEYGLAMTMDGAIVADKITSGTMYADRIRGGTLTLGGKGNTNGIFIVLDENGEEAVRMDRQRVKIKTTGSDMQLEIEDGGIRGYYNSDSPLHELLFGGSINFRGGTVNLNSDYGIKVNGIQGITVSKQFLTGISITPNTKMIKDGNGLYVTVVTGINVSPSYGFIGTSNGIVSL